MVSAELLMAHSFFRSQPVVATHLALLEGQGTKVSLHMAFFCVLHTFGQDHLLMKAISAYHTTRVQAQCNPIVQWAQQPCHSVRQVFVS